MASARDLSVALAEAFVSVRFASIGGSVMSAMGSTKGLRPHRQIAWVIFALFSIVVIGTMLASVASLAFPFPIMPAEKISTTVSLLAVFVLFLMIWRCLAAWFRLILLIAMDRK